MDDLTKLKRWFEIGSTLGVFNVKNSIKQGLNIKIDQEEYAKALKEILGNLKGPLMKVAQFLAIIPDALPKEVANELQELQSNAPAMGINFVKRRLKGEFGDNLSNYFKSFNYEASFAASLGQVHKAQLLDGKNVAVKLQYPNMPAIIQADLDQLSLVLKFYKELNKAIDPSDIFLEIKERLFEELDYTKEADNIELFHKINKECFLNSQLDFNSLDLDRLNFLKIPKVYKDISSNTVLVMDFLENTNIFKKQFTSAEQINDIGKKLFLSWYIPLYKYGVLHCDPHPGNYGIDDNDNIVLLDFGCIRKFDKNFLQAVIDLYLSFKCNDVVLRKNAYKQWGFDVRNDELFETIDIWARLLYDPLLDDCIRPLQTMDTGIKANNAIKEVYKKLQTFGGIKPPKEFVFMDRAAVGIGSVIMRLGSKQNWHKIFEQLIKDYVN